jgi:hypothetical protein
VIQLIQDYHSMGALLPQRAHAALARGDAKVMTIRLTTAARVFDMSPTGSTAPPGWMAPTFDDSSWDHATTQACAAQTPLHYLGGSPAPTRRGVWGPNSEHTYLLRQTFVVPKAASYYGSELDYTTTAALFDNGAKIPALAINGKSLYPQVDFNSPHGQVAIVHYLQPGLNVLTAAVNPSGCSTFADVITLRMTGLQRPTPLVLSWRKVPAAARYDVEVWLVKAAPEQTITPDSEVNIATQTTGPRATLDDATMPAGTYEWRTAAVNAHGSVISHWTPAQTVTLT